MSDEDLVSTKRGYLPRSQLEMRVLQNETETAVTVECEWYDKTDGELVRRDGFVNMKRGQVIGATQGSF